MEKEEEEGEVKGREGRRKERRKRKVKKYCSWRYSSVAEDLPSMSKAPDSPD